MRSRPSALQRSADHIIVRLKPGMSIADLKVLNDKYGAKIRKDMGTRSTYLVEFSHDDNAILPPVISEIIADTALE